MCDGLRDSLEVIQAVGAIATAITAILLLLKFRTKLVVKGEFRPHNIDKYLVIVSNRTQYDNEIISMSFWKGNPKGTMSTPVLIMSVALSSFGLEMNPNTNGIIVHKGDRVELPLCSCDIAAHYDTIGESIGKLYDKIYVQVRDRKGHTYVVNTHYNVDTFRLCRKMHNTNDDIKDCDNQKEARQENG